MSVRYSGFTVAGCDVVALSAGEIHNTGKTIPRMPKMAIFRIIIVIFITTVLVIVIFYFTRGASDSKGRLVQLLPALLDFSTLPYCASSCVRQLLDHALRLALRKCLLGSSSEMISSLGQYN